MKNFLKKMISSTTENNQATSAKLRPDPLAFCWLAVGPSGCEGVQKRHYYKLQNDQAILVVAEGLGTGDLVVFRVGGALGVTL